MECRYLEQTVDRLTRCRFERLLTYSANLVCIQGRSIVKGYFAVPQILPVTVIDVSDTALNSEQEENQDFAGTGPRYMSTHTVA
jgi:hypothetical protein